MFFVDFDLPISILNERTSLQVRLGRWYDFAHDCFIIQACWRESLVSTLLAVGGEVGWCRISFRSSALYSFLLRRKCIGECRDPFCTMLIYDASVIDRTRFRISSEETCSIPLGLFHTWYYNFHCRITWYSCS